jgi:hypothetical protein
VPSDLINAKLDDVEDELNGMGIHYSVDSRGHAVFDAGNWGVCSTTPGPGQSINGTVVLHVANFSCGASSQ